MLRERCIGFVITLVLAVGPSVAGAEPSAARVLADIRERGAETVLDELYAAERTWSPVLRGIRSGDRRWLEVGRQLKAVGGPSAPELTAAMAEALAVAPGDVLSLLGPEFDADDVCSLNTLEDTLGASYSGAVRKVEARQRAVRGVRSSELSRRRDDCLAFLAELRRAVDEQREEWFEKP